MNWTPRLSGWKMNGIKGKTLCRLSAVVLLILSVMIGINPADYDPFLDHPRSTYNLLAQEVSRYTNPNRAGRQWTQPPPGPNAEACKSVWDAGVPCKVDGKLYGYWGELQPDFCDNNYFLPDGKRLKPDAEKCHCNIAMTDADHCPMNDDGTTHLSVDGSTCQVYCREKGTEAGASGMTHCHCVLVCDAATAEDLKGKK